MTRRIQVLAAIAAFTVSAGFAHAQNSMNAGMSPAQAEQMLHSARTVEQYQMLAGYFHARQLVFEEKAQAEKAEWDRRSQITAASYQNLIDKQIASMALLYDLTIVSRNIDHFAGTGARVLNPFQESAPSAVVVSQ